MLCHLLLGKRFVTIRDKESVPGNSDDDVFLAEEEMQSTFQKQVAFMKTFGISANSAKHNGSHAGVPGDL